MAPKNTAAFLPEAKSTLTIAEKPYPTAGDNEIVVKVAAAAINPMDWFIQLLGAQLFPWLQYPYTPGSDIAGTVEQVGAGVAAFEPGDRVLGLAAGFESRAGGFQTYCAIPASLASPLPANLAFTDAAVLPLGLATAAAGLYQKDYLALTYPTPDSPRPTGKTLLVWAGASSVGSNAIQLAVASGYAVFTTASPKNFAYCKALGAARVFDYHSATVGAELLAAFEGTTCAGGFAIQRGCEETVFDVVLRSDGAKVVACAMPVPPTKPDGIKANFIFASTIKDNEVGPMIYNRYLPAALAAGKYQCAPPPKVVGHGLEKVQEGYDVGKRGGVSAEKLVVTL
ncbi:chaperonin 10-like protein [Lasiosphaeria miniovina]|uniref:Chaperonin 10-like protein n=1 Tax=Lasiosphaeria miniovina TaxID=1954250 RepID=A0AA40ACZ2_9PEZI|nr:chaperonin 10-like protein [Lasiosphaeria miniovina]KAK0713565.1 chaperonin 10-like protein [Lasiosphaeria miniovina]